MNRVSKFVLQIKEAFRISKQAYQDESAKAHELLRDN
jgi:hypothetical protein